MLINISVSVEPKLGVTKCYVSISPRQPLMIKKMELGKSTPSGIKVMQTMSVNPLTAKISNWNFHPVEVLF